MYLNYKKTPLDSMVCFVYYLCPRSAASGVPTKRLPLWPASKVNHRELFVVASAVPATSAVENMEG